MNVCYFMATTDLDGGAQSLLDIVKYMKNTDIVSHVLLSKHYKPLEDILEKYSIKYKIIWRGTDSKSKFFLKTFIKIIVNKIAEIRTRLYIKNNRIDILHNNSVLSVTGMKAAYKEKIPYICHVRELIEDGLNEKMISYKDLYYYMNKSSKIIFISDYVMSKYIENIHSDNYVVLADGIDTERYVQQRRFGNNIHNISMIGRYHRNKGQMDIIKAVDILVNKYNFNIKLRLAGSIGDEDYYKMINDYVVEKGLTNNIEINTFSEDLQELRRASDICIVSSNFEALGRVTVEGMLSSQLVIGADKPATNLIIKNNYNGLLYKLGDYKQLANIIIDVINNSDKYENVVKQGFKYAMDNYDNKNQNKKLYSIYSKVKEG